MPSVLIAGAGICGPVLAWWLARAGWTCTIVERDNKPRLTGQQVDVRGAATTIIAAMGLEDAVRAASVKEKGVAFVDDHGRRRACMPSGEDQPGHLSDEIEILRGELAAILTKAVTDMPNVRVIYGDKIVDIQDRADDVEVTFESGASWSGQKLHSFDVVVAADGMHSSTRKLIFPELSKAPLHSLD